MASKGSRQKSKTGRVAGGDGLPRGSKLKKFILPAILLGLLVLFWWRGGVTGAMTSVAEQSLKRWKMEEAEKWLSRGSALRETARAEFLLARIARINSDIDGMFRHLIRAHELGYPASELNREQDLLRISQGEMDATLDAKARSWIAEHPEDLNFVVDAYANGLASQSRFPEAADVLGAYERAEPTDPMVNYRLGIMNEHLKSKALAEEQYKIALAKDPSYIKAIWCLARIKAGANSPQEAIQLLQSVNPGGAQIAFQTMIAHCYQQSGDQEKGRELLLQIADQGFDAAAQSYKVVDETPERFLAASELGVLDTKLGNWDEAKKFLELALDANPNDFIARNSYAQVLRRLGEKEKSQLELERIAKERSEFDKITILREKVNQDAADVGSRMEMGRIIFQYESEKFGLFWIRSTLTYDPNFQPAHQFLADYYSTKAATAKSDSEKQFYEQKSQYHASQITPPTSS